MSATNVARAGKRGNICVRNIVSSFATALKLRENEEIHTFATSVCREFCIIIIKKRTL